MGLLDDAIREHLDLKRRRGADPAEVERAEREALGPVRRNREPDVDEAELTSEAPPADDRGDAFAYDHEAEEGEWAGHGQEAEEPDWTGHGNDPDESFEDDPSEAGSHAPGPPAEHDPESFATAPPPPQRPRDLTGSETAEYDVEGALSASAGEESDDVLEETPEFLQDTPDHDRLWFEQRPPKDFDFDG
ncbi:MAG: hypothetical protein ACRDMJ_01885 [Solirubrobacteraceae bacterium]